MADDAHDRQPSDTEFAVTEGSAPGEQPTHGQVGGQTSGWRRVRPVWYVAAGVAILAVAGVVIGVLVSRSAPVTTGTIGETLHLHAANADVTGPTVPLDVTVSAPAGTFGSQIKVRLTNTSGTQTALLTNQPFVIDDGTGTWTGPTSQTLFPGTGGEIGPGQTATGTFVFPVSSAARILFNPGGFVVDPNGNPIHNPSEVTGTWNFG
jgi:hypothetical protein